MNEYEYVSYTHYINSTDNNRKMKKDFSLQEISFFFIDTKTTVLVMLY